MQQPLFAALALLAGSLLVGLGFCVLLPPFEGFDETAHYGYIQQIAQTGTWPRLNDPLPAEVDDYLKVAPSPRALSGRWTYPAFFAAAPPAAIRAATAAIHGERDPARPWRASKGNNWEGQHPPMAMIALVMAWHLGPAAPVATSSRAHDRPDRVPG